MIEIIGIVLIVQGAGGFINRIVGSDGLGWFVQLHLLPLALHIPVSIVMAVVGLAMSSTKAIRKRTEQ